MTDLLADFLVFFAKSEKFERKIRAINTALAALQAALAWIEKISNYETELVTY